MSPYIGKLKSLIANDLIKEFSNPGDLIVDPFSGSGTIPLEALLLNRNVFASDISLYSSILTKAKIAPPASIDVALKEAERLLNKSEKLKKPDLRKVPKWVRSFFHSKTLKEIICFVTVCKKERNPFLLSCLLGILHHQRPGFLSRPSSHLVPYLRDKKYPQKDFPEMYEYRELRPRLLAKIKRAYKRIPQNKNIGNATFRKSSIENLSFSEKFDCLITSPPYMNALNYGRDNRLRLWVLDPSKVEQIDKRTPRNKNSFKNTIKILAQKVEENLKSSGHCVIIVGERLSQNGSHLSDVVCDTFKVYAPSLCLSSLIVDKIPDIRRTRKNCSNTKKEHILIFKKG